MIAIVDYDAGNLHSVGKAAETVGLRAATTARPEDLEAADAVILPGVGAFGACMARLQERGFVGPLRRYLAEDRPFLGICLGLQLLLEHGEEGDGAPGLGFLPGRVVRLRAPGLKVPQIGWNALRLRRPTPLFAGIPDGTHFYFVHSFHAALADPADLVADVAYGEPVTAAVARGRIHAVQFHPEKSSAAGLRLLANFGALAGGAAA
jgi:glutamine amidotransferase